MDQPHILAAKGLALLVSIMSPIAPVMATAGTLVVVDTVTGVWAAIKYKHKITSHKFKRVVVKTFGYLTAIFIAHLIEKYMIGDAIPMVKTVSGLIAMTEGKSIFENLRRITGIDLWKAMLDKLQGDSIKLMDKE